MDWPQAYLHGACKLHYERKKSNKYKKNSPLNPCIKISQQEASKLLQKLFETSFEASLHYQDITSYPNTTNHQLELYRLQNLQNNVSVG